MFYEEIVILGNPLWEWFLAILAAVLAWFVLSFGRHYLTRYLKGRPAESWYAKSTAAALDKTKNFFIIALSILFGLAILEITPEVALTLVAAIFIIQLGIWGHEFLNYLLGMEDVARTIEEKTSRGALHAIGVILRTILWALIFLFLLQNLGIEIGPLLAGLGIGGIAIALAAQNILGDVFASLSILIDKPFVQGDFIAVGDFRGAVERIGIKTTRLRSLSGEQLIFSNNDLLTSRIQNYKRMIERRVSFAFKTPYDTPIDKVKLIPVIVKEIVDGEKLTRFDRSHFKEFGPYGLHYETVFYMTEPAYGTYMDVQERINLKLMERFGQKGIQFAFLESGGLIAE